MERDVKIVFLSMFLLLMTGIVMIYSSSAVYADGVYGDSMYFVQKHLAYMAIGILAAVYCMAISVKKLRASAGGFMLIMILILIAVLVPGIGSKVKGARRWLRFFGFGIQPSEIAKLALIVYIADFTSRKRHLIRNLRYGFIPPVFAIGLTSALILVEPDMGTSVAILFIGFMMLLVSGADMRHLLSVAASAIPVLLMAVIFAPYRMRRILSFRDPFSDARGAGFQLCQSFIALGSGGVTGVGLGESQQKLFYLPESHTDFIFSIIGEELGFLGAASVLVLFVLLIGAALRVSFKLKDTFASRVIFGISVMIAFEVIVNIGVSTGIWPTKGLPLPFISYGGSSIVAHLAAMGLFFNMAKGAE
ncbi:MAG: putative lipid II flippase FtsW [Candidatus Omnitrophota bacterium]